MAGVLKQIAAQMWAEAMQTGRSSRNLSGGLFVVCKVENGTRKLGLCRIDSYVPFDEAAIAATAFDVPKGIRREDIKHGKTTWAVYTWSFVAEQRSMFGESEAPR